MTVAAATDTCRLQRSGTEVARVCFFQRAEVHRRWPRIPAVGSFRASAAVRNLILAEVEVELEERLASSNGRRARDGVQDGERAAG